MESSSSASLFLALSPLATLAGTLIFILLKRKPKEEKHKEKKETLPREEIEAYEEALN